MLGNCPSIHSVPNYGFDMTRESTKNENKIKTTQQQKSYIGVLWKVASTVSWGECFDLLCIYTTSGKAIPMLHRNTKRMGKLWKMACRTTYIIQGWDDRSGENMEITLMQCVVDYNERISYSLAVTINSLLELAEHTAFLLNLPLLI